MTIMGKICAVLALGLLVGCLRAQERVKMISSPQDDPSFVTRCGHSEGCLADAKEVCPSGYKKITFEGDTRERELTFKCNGKADW